MSLSKTVLLTEGYINRKLTAQLKTSPELSYKDVGRLLKIQIGFEKIQCFQPLSPGRFQITFYYMRHLIEAYENGLQYGDENYDITPIYSPEKNILIRNAPYELPNELLVACLSSYGKVGNIEFETDPEFGCFNGNRRCKMTADNNIPNFIRIDKCNLMITYAGVKPLCRKCHSDQHLASECDTPLCKICFIYGHVATECLKRKPKPSEKEPEIVPQNQDQDETENEAHDPEPDGELSSANTSTFESRILFSEMVTRPPTPMMKTPPKKINKPKDVILKDPLKNVSSLKKKKSSFMSNNVSRPLVSENEISPMKTRTGKNIHAQKDDLNLSEESD